MEKISSYTNHALLGVLKYTTEKAIQSGTMHSSHVESLKEINNMLSKIVLEKSNKTLVVFDLNDVLIEREYDTNRKSVREGWERVGNFHVRKKPGVEELLSRMFETPGYEVAVWSSISKYNIGQYVNFTFGDHASKLLFVYSQSECERVDQGGENETKPLFLKNLTEVWAKYPQYDNTNTLLIDDTDAKSINNPARCHFNPLKEKGKDTVQEITRELFSTIY